MLTDLEKKVIASVQGDLPICSQPYRRIAEDLGIPESLLLETLENLCRQGVIRRFGATLRHQRSGFHANAMVAWRVEEDRINQVGEMFASYEAVSHCYRRNPTKEWPYNLYTMVHANDEPACKTIARRMSKEAAVDDYELLFSRRELKKTSMEYFTEKQNYMEYWNND
jgi:DNA-binding Lrp family transcriptional regulator